jgi:hypothetical protein
MAIERTAFVLAKGFYGRYSDYPSIRKHMEKKPCRVSWIKSDASSAGILKQTLSFRAIEQSRRAGGAGIGNAGTHNTMRACVADGSTRFATVLARWDTGSTAKLLLQLVACGRGRKFIVPSGGCENDWPTEAWTRKPPI